MRTDSIIFDLDGTLVDSFHDIYDAFKGAAIDLRLPALREDDVRGRMHLRLDQMVADMFPGTDAETFMRRYRERYDGSGYPNTHLYPGVEGTLKVLRERGCQLFVATNKRKRATEAIISRAGLEGVFGLVVPSDVSDPPLNKAGLVRRIMMDRGLEPSRTVLVGDTKGDWEAANENGIRFILAGFGYGNIHPDEVRDKRIVVISSFEELVPALDR